MALRDIDQIQEDERGRPGRLGTLVLASLGTAAVVFAVAAVAKKPSAPPGRGATALDELAVRTQGAASARRPDLTAQDVTFPQLLSDGDNPTTALAAIQGPGQPQPGATAPFVLPPGSPTTPPPPGDRIPVVPLPAQRILGASPVVTEPRDPLTAVAKDKATDATSGPMAEAGHAGAVVLQIASFRTEGEATAFANVLRRRSHRAYVEAASIPGRGTWHRVRVGPYPSARDANKARVEFEQKEHMVPFVVEEAKEKKLVEQREAEKKAREARRKHR